MLREELRGVLLAAGAELVGFADLDGVPNCPLPQGAAVAVALPAEVLRDIQEGPTRLYYETYHKLNARLNAIVSAGAACLQERGYQAMALTTEVVKRDENDHTALPHKTVALGAGLGWIGKNNLLVTPEFGGAVRLSSLLSDAPLGGGKTPLENRCGNCHACVDACPAGALRGKLWTPGTDRDEMFDRSLCMEKAKGLMRSRAGVEADICGQCFVACPHTRAYLRRASSSSS